MYKPLRYFVILIAFIALSCGGDEPAEEPAQTVETTPTGETTQSTTSDVPATVTASHILVAYDGAERSTATRSRSEASELLQRIEASIRNDSLTFEEAAIQYSDCPSGASGGNLGSFGRGAMVPEFEDAAFALEPGDMSSIIETPFGFHLIKRTR
ncbi:peptidylprolyl isomerase [Candidatus Fermentibacteria bacterium]|nr:peptidylprolyl isomerase [Candidatus Fermentibacteria bacterium]